MKTNFAQITNRFTSGVDFRRFHKIRSSPFAVIAPHAGGIEPGTGKVARQIAGNQHSLYVFEGFRRSGNLALHISSVEFDDPLCQSLFDESKVAITIHGCAGEMEAAYIGGLHRHLIRKVIHALDRSGFYAARDRTGHAGLHPSNLCNRGQLNKGVQIELTRGLRKTFFKSLDRVGRENPTEPFYRFCRAVQSILRKP